MGKREKITYIDDGRTLADMSGFSERRLSRTTVRTPGRAKSIWSTYWHAVRMMFLPMLAVIGALVVIYGVMYLLFTIA